MFPLRLYSLLDHQLHFLLFPSFPLSFHLLPHLTHDDNKIMLLMMMMILIIIVTVLTRLEYDSLDEKYNPSSLQAIFQEIAYKIYLSS